MVDYIVLPYCLLLCIRLLAAWYAERTQDRCQGCDRCCPTVQRYPINSEGDSVHMLLCLGCRGNAEERCIQAETTRDFLVMLWLTCP